MDQGFFQQLIAAEENPPRKAPIEKPGQHSHSMAPIFF
jgi:hypothetical protein